MHSASLFHSFHVLFTFPHSLPSLLSYLPHELSLQDRVEVNGARLKISNLALEDSGMYQCVAENKHGTIYSTAELRVQGTVDVQGEFVFYFPFRETKTNILSI